mgnify:CR=1 FL=1
MILVSRFSGMLFLLIFLSNILSAQKTESYRNTDELYLKGKDLFRHEQYESARKHFSDYLRLSGSEHSEDYVNAKYYQALSAMRLFHKDAEYLMENFVDVYPESIWVHPARWNLATYNFNRRDYDDALYWYNQIDQRDLDFLEKEESLFNTGFSAFQEEQYEKAKLSFYELKDNQNSDYQPASAYYYGYIAYTEENYETALKSFKSAQSNPDFENVIPYYIAQIYHFQEKYDELIEYGPALMEKEDVMRKDELSLLIGNAYFQKENYTEALPYLETYANSNPGISPEEAYQVGYTYYRNDHHPDAIKYFQRASKSEDPALVQVATYQMGGAYLEMDEKKYAQNAFQVASQSSEDKEIQEDALFNYAKLAYELSYDPFHEAIQAFENYLETYPNSNRKDEAYEFLIRVFIATKNYSGVLNAMDKMQNLNAAQKIVYQECAYNRAVESVITKSYDRALTEFDDVKRYNSDPKLQALADYWEGDIHYKQKNYDKAIRSYQNFISNPSAYQTEYYNLANYNIGYCHFKLANYNESLEAFRKYTAAVKTDDRRKNDAYLRIGDLNLVNKSYNNAIDNYALALKANESNADYAMFQTAQAYGYQENYSSKISTLNSLLTEHPETSLAAVSNFELGDSYFLKNNLDEALSAFNKVIDNYPDSPYRKKALLKKGLVEYRMGSYEDAIATYKKVVSDYGVDAESNEAIATLKSIYLDLGRVDDYTAWLNDIPDYEISPKEVDSLSYQVAENYISEGNCDKAISSFESYLNKFPNGLFVLNANYYIADCAYRKNNYDKAIEGFEYVAEKPISQFSEPSLFGAASIRYSRKEYEKALNHYERLKQVASFESNILEAQIGIMRCAYKLGEYENALDAIAGLKQSAKIPADILKEVELTEGRIHFNQNSYEKARPIFERISQNENTKEGAEAQFRLAQIEFEGGDFEKSEEMLFSLIQNYPAQDFWKIKGFLLLADIYTEREDYFQARATLQSILDNVTDSTIVNQAEEKLAMIEKKENDKIIERDTLPREDTLDFENEYDELINDEEIPEDE